MYKIYEVNSRKHYNGIALISAESAEEANAFIQEFVDNDIKNFGDSWGYEDVNEQNVIDGICGIKKGILLYGIYYHG